MKQYKILFATLWIALFSILSCKDDDNDPCDIEFDQKAMFENIADNLIVSEYKNLLDETTQLVNTSNAFIESPNEANFTALSESFLEVYTHWQRVAQYEFGPAEEIFLRNNINNFPVNEEAVNANIESGNYNLDDPNTFDKGLPALDYVLWEKSTPEVIALFEAEDSKHAAFLQAIVQDIDAKINTVYDGWINGYRDTFVNNTGTATGSSLSLLLNNFNEHYELLKRDKLGVPSGAISTLGFTYPERVEGYYSKISGFLLQNALTYAKLLYVGNDGLGLDDYLIAADARKDGELLDDLIQAQFTAAISAVASLDESLSQVIENDNDLVINAYSEVSKQLVNIKTDMPSVLCVSITYIDNPSDSD